jgi:hypothetical protein
MQENFVSLEHVLLAQKMQLEMQLVLLTMELVSSAVEEPAKMWIAV